MFTIDQKLLISLSVFLGFCLIFQIIGKKKVEALYYFSFGVCIIYFVNVMLIEKYWILDIIESGCRGIFFGVYLRSAFKAVCGDHPYSYSKFQHQLILKRSINYYCWEKNLESCQDVNRIVLIIACWFFIYETILIARICIYIYLFTVSNASEIDSTLIITTRFLDIFITTLVFTLIYPISPTNPHIHSLILPSLPSMFTTILQYSSISESFYNRVFLSSSFNFLYTLIQSYYSTDI